MPRIAKAALAALAAAALVLAATWVIDFTYLRYGADFTYAGYVPATPPPEPAPADAALPAATDAGPGTGTIAPPTATHPGVTAPDGGPPTDSGVRRAPPAIPPMRDPDAGRMRLVRSADGGLVRPLHLPRLRPAGSPPTKIATATPSSPQAPPTPLPAQPRPLSPYANTIVERRVERAAQLYTVVRAQARVMNAWDFLRLGPLFERPKVLVRIRARLGIDRTGLWRFDVRGGGRGVLTIDGVPLATAPQRPSVAIPLARGDHDFDLAWRIEEPGDRLVTYAAVGSSPFRSLNARAFRPPLDAPDDHRTTGWILGALAACLAALLAAWTFAATHRATALRRAALATGLAILLVGIGLRTWDYDVVPQYGQIGDELFVTWNGWSILTEGKTRGWSLWPEQYAPLVEVRRVRFLGVDFQSITPYFEHPPLMHLLVGGAAHLGGAHHWLEARVTHTRLVPLALSSLALLLVMLLARKLD